MPLQTVDLSRSTAADGATAAPAFQPTAEELRTIHQKMSDPTFAKLMHEYMQSLQDPETLREEQAYLEQAEREAREGGDSSFTFVFPKPGFAVELTQPSTRQVSVRDARKAGFSASAAAASNATAGGVQLFVNLCTSERVEAFSEERIGDSAESSWQVPVSVSARRVEAVPASLRAGESAGEERLCHVYDAVLHPTSLSLADRSQRFLALLVDIAVEQINAGYGETNSCAFRRLPSSVPSVGQPRNQTVRTKTAAGEASLTAGTATQQPSGEPASAPAQAVTEPAPALPPHTIAHRGHIDLSDAWQWRMSERRVGVPEELVVRLTFDGITRAAALDIDITSDGSAVQVAKTPLQQRYEGLLVLPFTVDPTPRKAALDKASGMLTLVLAVVPPALRAGDQHAAEELRDRLVGDRIKPLACPEAPAATADSVQLPAPAATDTAAPPPAAAQLPAAEPHGSTDVEKTTASADAPPPLRQPRPEDFSVGDERSQRMLAKVQEARLARQAAAAAERTAAVADAVVVDAAAVDTAVVDAAAADAAVTDAPVPATATEVDVNNDESMPFIQKRKPAKEVEAAELQARQEAWTTMVQQQMELLATVDAQDTEAAEAARLAERERAQSAKRLAAAQAAAEVEARAAAVRAAVPLSNKFIFSID